MTCVIIASGPYIDENRLFEIAENRELYFVICADGGYRHTKKFNIVPDEIIGDLDSISEEEIPSSVQLYRLPVQKDDTDTRAAINLGLQKRFIKFELHGMLGARIDHSLANLSDLYYLYQQGAAGKIVDPFCDVEIITGKTQIDGKIGETISFMMYGAPPKGITLKGFQYPLTDYVGDIGFQIGISNMLVEERAEVSVLEGYLLMMRIKKK